MSSQGHLSPGPSSLCLVLAHQWYCCRHPPAQSRLLPSSLERGQCICQELKSFGVGLRTFLVHRMLAGNVVSIKWDVNFHEDFPYGCSLWSVSNLAITMWSVGHTAWAKFKKLAVCQQGGARAQIHVFSRFFFFFLLISYSLQVVVAF